MVAESAELLGRRAYRPEDGERLAQALEGICADTGDPEVTTELAILSRRPPMQQTGASRAFTGSPAGRPSATDCPRRAPTEGATAPSPRRPASR